ncbi:helix-turn-helix domain-containing protein [Methylobacterium terricola]|uniref:Helix-turn-helix domain-containing protein n=1 Tax=Methylobacterium terricola TaxID=2583531 RepID=A0A5C4LE30_9HYPH|nr:helix-turn-helix domain-containing protein [Methylobacterium terricola]TNC10819.1 helix-turn-helix domain-containing protein [Methylobacterium terricola]
MSTNEVKPVFYCPRDVAVLLNVSQRTVYKLIKAGRLPHIRIGNMIRVNLADVRALSYEHNADR